MIPHVWSLVKSKIGKRDTKVREAGLEEANISEEWKTNIETFDCYSEKSMPSDYVAEWVLADRRMGVSKKIPLGFYSRDLQHLPFLDYPFLGDFGKATPCTPYSIST